MFPPRRIEWDPYLSTVPRTHHNPAAQTARAPVPANTGRDRSGRSLVTHRGGAHERSHVVARHQPGGMSRRVQYRDRQGAVRVRCATSLARWTTGLGMASSRPIAYLLTLRTLAGHGWRPWSGCRHGLLLNFSTGARGPSWGVLRTTCERIAVGTCSP